MQISKGIIIHYLNNMPPSQVYDLQSIQRIRIDPYNTYNRPWYFYRIFNSSDSAAFDIFVSLFYFFFSDSTYRQIVSL